MLLKPAKKKRINVDGRKEVVKERPGGEFQNPPKD